MSLFIGRIPRDMRSQELEETFSKFGKFTRFDIKHNQGYGFIEFEDKRDAEDAIKQLKDAAFIVEWAKGGHRPGTSECFHCGETGHWARDCSKAPSRERGRRDGGRGYDRDRRFFRDRDSDRRRDDRGRDRSPRRSDNRFSGSDRRDSDRRNGDKREERRERDDDERKERRDRDDKRDDERKERRNRDERRRDDDRND